MKESFEKSNSKYENIEKLGFSVENISEKTIAEIKEYYQKIGAGFLNVPKEEKDEKRVYAEKLFTLLNEISDGKFLDHAHPNHVWGTASQQAGNSDFDFESKLNFHNQIPTFFGGNTWITKNPESILVIMGSKNEKFKKILEQSNFYPKSAYSNDEYKEYKFKTPEGKDSVLIPYPSGTASPQELVIDCIINEIPIYVQYKEQHEHDSLSEMYGDEIYLDEIELEHTANRLKIPFTWASFADTVVDLKNGKIYKCKN